MSLHSQFNSHNDSSRCRSPSSLSNNSISNQVDFLSGIESVQAPSFQSTFLPTSYNDLHHSQSFPTLLRQQSPVNSLHSLQSASSLPCSSLCRETTLSGQSTYTTFEPNNSSDIPSTEKSHDLELTPHSMSVASDSYFGTMQQPNSNQYFWDNRSYQHLQQPQQQQPQQMTPQFPPLQSYPSSAFPINYGGHPNGQMQSYHQDSAPSAYMPSSSAGARQHYSRSPPMTRPYTSHSNGIPEQPLLAPSPPYMMSQPSYYLPNASQIPSSHHSPMSSQASSLINDPVFPPADSMPISDADRQVRVISSRPRPQCWDHGCNGREFSTFSNLLRHQREKSGVVAKAECPICRAVFTRTTARNIHVAQGKCKGTGRESSSE